MIRRLAPLVGALLLVTLVAGSAGAYVDNEIEYLQQQVWLHAGTTPVGNVDTLAGTPISWDATEPTGSGTAAGGVTVGNNYSTFTDFVAPTRQSNTLTIAGSFTGRLGTIAVDLWWTGPATALCTDASLAFDLTIDGVQVLFQDQGAPSANLNTSPDGDHQLTRFIFTNLPRAMDEYGIAEGADVTHEIRVNMANFYACNEMVFLYDTVETPTALTFNLDPKSKAAKPYTKVDVFNPPPPLES